MLYHKIAALIAGSLLIAVGVNCFLMPFKVLDGGIIGIALIMNYLFKVQVGLVIILCSIPIFTLAWFYCRELVYNSLHGMLLSSYLIDLLEPFHYYFIYYVKLSPWSSAVLGGLIVGVGIGIMLRYDTSTGGTDLFAQFLSRYVPFNVGVIILMLDTVIVSFGGLLLSAETFVLSIITISVGGMATTLCTLK
ncbi:MULTISPECIES: YitT family protein [unclassified Paenibacillus]|uniref:YitT family protein n=1 Tax=unclassified Paenibacillus TaxID=185978 RepID=UPI001AE1E51F|nr:MULTISPECIES: YitT family protein [unclassified Paenibacillus]MBP1157441.1 uncharacterized membrane-anchored protein YitT (DUF2179 family) [Paenibacillus sp. PvP091]MBP1171821.1 uncharacterized membrane-anchored protein YitT (DUF2179 family) [Paenibacillus sp. PvR098]MBP2438202.1 uncharacterized membrane-anchored protein YitT (DUF2179 family) [Paenibacillus sp. PvP052]